MSAKETTKRLQVLDTSELTFKAHALNGDMLLLNKNIIQAIKFGWCARHKEIPATINLSEVFNDLCAVESSIQSLKEEMAKALGNSQSKKEVVEEKPAEPGLIEKAFLLTKKLINI